MFTITYSQETRVSFPNAKPAGAASCYIPLDVSWPEAINEGGDDEKGKGKGGGR